MASGHVTVTIRLADAEPFRLLVWELRMLADRMRIEASPHAEALENALDRFTAPVGDDEPESDR
jgi:hypothetical protein